MEVELGAFARGGVGILIINPQVFFGECGGEQEPHHAAAAPHIHHPVVSIESDLVRHSFSEGEAAHIGTAVAKAPGERDELKGSVPAEGDGKRSAVVGQIGHGHGVKDAAGEDVNRAFAAQGNRVAAGFPEAFQKGFIKGFIGGNQQPEPGKEGIGGETLKECEVLFGRAIAFGHLPKSDISGGHAGEIRRGGAGEAEGCAGGGQRRVIFGKVSLQGALHGCIQRMEGEGALYLAAAGEPKRQREGASSAAKEKGRAEGAIFGFERRQLLNQGALGWIEAASRDNAKGFAQKKFFPGVRMMREGDRKHGGSLRKHISKLREGIGEIRQTQEGAVIERGWGIVHNHDARPAAVGLFGEGSGGENRKRGAEHQH